LTHLLLPLPLLRLGVLRLVVLLVNLLLRR
jgi:hypothetical protein